MKLFRKIAAITGFVGGTLFGLSFAQRKGSDFRNKLYKGIKSGKTTDLLSEEFSAVGKDIWQTALGVKDSNEVQQIIADSQTKLKELSQMAQSYGGEVAEVLSKKYQELAKDLEKQAKDLHKSASKQVKKTVKQVTKKIQKKLNKKKKLFRK